MEKRFNINEQVRVKLTGYGLEMYMEFSRRANKGLPPDAQYPLTPAVDDQGYYKEQLWKLMQVFGPGMRHHMPEPFEDMEILINSRHLKGSMPYSNLDPRIINLVNDAGGEHIFRGEDTSSAICREADGTFSEFNDLGPAVMRYDANGKFIAHEFLSVDHLPDDKQAKAVKYKGHHNPFIM